MTVRSLLAIATLSLATTTAAFAAEGTFNRNLSVGSSPNVSVATGSGNIHIHPGSDSQIHIVGHVHSSNNWFGADAESRVRQIVDNPPIVQNGNDVTIGERHNNDLFRNISIDYDIALPRASNISAITGSGDLEVQDAGSTLKAQTGSGGIRARGVTGASTLGTGSGDIDFQQNGSGDVRAETGSGNISLRGVSGSLKSSTGSGNINIQGQLTAEWKVSTGSGNVELALGNGARFNLIADTGSGSVQVSQPITMQGSLNRHHITGAVNGGGPTLHTNTGSGDITIR
ncbi:MAG TPA: DUF4097 family beta strand repeat-containing protein [Edaphobacter sp.]|nr:DUF4097 family beta strand repeat-containing protein [Edaphobacter sp.]